MSRLYALAVVSALAFGLGCPMFAYAQAGEQRLPRAGFALKMSSLGAGLEVAARVSNGSNVRVGFNDFAFDHDFTEDGDQYAAQLSLFSLQATYDWFPRHGSFHLSPGLLAYNGNRLTANTSSNAAAQAAPGIFSQPVTGSARIQFARVAPMFLVGWGNIIPRSGRRFSVPFEFGFVYHGDPKTSLHMNRIVCNPGDMMCITASADPSIATGFQQEQMKIKQEVAPFKFYPVVSLGLGYRF